FAHALPHGISHLAEAVRHRHRLPATGHPSSKICHCPWTRREPATANLAALGTTVQLSSASFAVTIGLALPVIQNSPPPWPPPSRLAPIARSASCGVQMR